MTGILSRFSFLSSSERKAKNIVKVSDEPSTEIEAKALIGAKRFGSSSRKDKKDRKRLSSSAELLQPVAKPSDPFSFDDSLKCLTPRASIANDGVELLLRTLTELHAEQLMEAEQITETAQQTERHRDSNLLETDVPERSGNCKSPSPQSLTYGNQEERQDEMTRRPLRDLFDQRQSSDAG